ncbi:protein of unknown function [Xenorhabdus nematophila AN6/1]|nr:protein of unknown function [Xenorhabdus nematophila AN6/1]
MHVRIDEPCTHGIHSNSLCSHFLCQCLLFMSTVTNADMMPLLRQTKRRGFTDTTGTACNDRYPVHHAILPIYSVIFLHLILLAHLSFPESIYLIICQLSDIRLIFKYKIFYLRI